MGRVWWKHFTPVEFLNSMECKRVCVGMKETMTKQDVYVFVCVYFGSRIN